MNLNTLSGKWLFIGAEKFNNQQWLASDNFIEGMTWTFYPQYFGQTKTLGQISETTPTEEVGNMGYSYNHQTRLLSVEIHGEPTDNIFDDPQCDKYEVIATSDGSPEQPIIKLSILNRGSYAPHFRYSLQKIE